jgi:Leucine-rich repeat (LRR) protein
MHLFQFFRLILLSFVCLMIGAAVGRELECRYNTWTDTLRPSYNYCATEGIDFSAKFETEKHSFASSSSEKIEITAFGIQYSPQVDFIPLEIFTEFPNLRGLTILDSKLATLKTDLFKVEFKEIEYLELHYNNIETIEPEAFQHLIKLQWIRLFRNNLQTLPDRLFENNPDLIYIDLAGNKINSIVSNFFDGLEKLKLVEFKENLCIDEDIGCETCLVTQSDLNEKLQNCHNPNLAQTGENTSENPSSENPLSGIAKALRNSLETLTRKLESGYEFGEKAVKEADGKMEMLVRPGKD